MARDRAVLQAWSQLTGALDIVPGATFTLYEPGTGVVATPVAGGVTAGTPFSSPVYGAKTGGAPLGPVIAADATGQRIVYVDAARTMDVGVQHGSIAPYVRQFESWELDPENVVTAVNAAALPGVKEGGTTDCWAPFQGALDALALDGQGMLHVPAGVFRVSGALKPGANVDIDGSGTLLFDDPTDAALLADPTLGYCIYANDAWDPLEVSCTGTLAEGLRAVRLANVADLGRFAPGDVVQVYTTAFSNSTATTAPLAPWTTRVADTETSGGAGYVWLAEASPWAFTSGTVKLRVRASKTGGAGHDGIRIRGVRIAIGDGAGHEILARNRNKGVYLAGVRGAVIEGVTFAGGIGGATGNEAAVYVWSSVDVRVAGCLADHLFSSRTLAEGGGNNQFAALTYCSGLLLQGNMIRRTPWGIGLSGCVRSDVRDTQFSGRPGIVPGADPATTPDGDATGDADFLRWQGRGVRLYACKHVTVSGNRWTDVGGASYFLNSSYCSYTNNGVDTYGSNASEVAIGVYDYPDASGAGLSHHVTVAHNVFHKGKSNAVQFVNYAALGGRHVVAGNLIEGFAGDGIQLDGPSHCVVAGNSVDNCGGAGIRLINGASFNAVTGNDLINNAANGLLISTGCGSNTAVGNTLYGTVPLKTDGSSGGNLLADNAIPSGTPVLHPLDEPSAASVLTGVDATTTSTTVLAGLSTAHAVSLFCHGGRVRLTWSGPVTPAAANVVSLGFAIDGAVVGTSAGLPAGATRQMVSFHEWAQPARGQHTFSLVASSSGGGTATVPTNTSGVRAVLSAEEARR